MLLQSYAVTHLVLCGRPDKDDHVLHAQQALQGSGTTELHLAPLVPEDPRRGRTVSPKMGWFRKNVGIEITIEIGFYNGFMMLIWGRIRCLSWFGTE